MTSRARAASRQRRRAHAKALTRAAVDIERVIPSPPEPAWDHWWHPTERKWYRHDDRIIRYADLLRRADVSDTAGDCAAVDGQIIDLLAKLELNG